MLTNQRVIKWPKWWVVLSHDMFKVSNFCLGKPAKISQNINLSYEAFKNKHWLCMRRPTYGHKNLSLEWFICIRDFKDKKDELCKLQKASDKIRRAFTLPYNSWCAEPFKLTWKDYCDNEFTAYWYPDVDYDCDLDLLFCQIYFTWSFVLFPEYYWECKEVKCNKVHYFCWLPVWWPIVTWVKTTNYKRETIFEQKCKSIMDKKLYYDHLKDKWVEVCELQFDWNFWASVYIQVTWTVENLSICNVSNWTWITTTWSTTDLIIEPSQTWTNLFENCSNSNWKIISWWDITLDCWVNEILITWCAEWDVEICFQYFDTYV